MGTIANVAGRPDLDHSTCRQPTFVARGVCRYSNGGFTP
jgi:hypothetical protein